MGLEKFLIELLVREVRAVELKLAAIEARLISVEARLSDLSSDMRKILEKGERRRWPI